METYAIDFSISDNELLTTLAVGVGALCFLFYWFFTHAEGTKQWFFKRNNHDAAWTKYIFFCKLFGFTFLGIIPVTVLLIVFPDLTLKYFGVYFDSKTALFSLMWIIALWVPIVLLTYNYTKNPKHHGFYPQIRANNWNVNRLFVSLFGWTIYTLGYEILFRGVLFVPLVQMFGMWPAIAINIALYSISHVPKGLQDVMGSILMGTVLCILTLKSGTIWISFFAHVSIGVTSTFTGIKYNESMTYFKRSSVPSN
jgi:membrane protease YdiL (CAAX protease family)